MEEYNKVKTKMRLGSQTIRESIYQGATQGAWAWSVYAIVECWFSSILPRLIWPSHEYRVLHQGFTAFLFVIYPALGLLLGGLFGLFLHKAAYRLHFLQKIQSPGLFRAVGTATVISAFALNLIVQFRFRFFLSLYIIVVSILLFSILLLLSLASTTGANIWPKRLGFVASPWTSSIILLGTAWIIKDLLNFVYSPVLRAGSVFIFFIAIYFVSFLIQKTIEKRLTTESIILKATESFTIRVLFMFVVLGTSFFLNRVPMRMAQSSGVLSVNTNQCNIFLIVMDTVRADHLSLYGYERDSVPTLKKFSDQATLFTHAIASSSNTLPTHASLFTGMYPIKHGAHHIYPPRRSPDGVGISSIGLAHHFDTLAEILSEKGYMTIGVSANHGWLAPLFRLNQGFQYYDSRVPISWTVWQYYLRHRIHNLLNYGFRSPHGASYRRAEEINREIFTLLDIMRKRGERSFFFINYMDAHYPYLPLPPFDKLYPGKDETFTKDRYDSLRKQVMELERRITKEESSHLISQYDGGIAYLDFHIGKLLTRLKELGIYENSLIIFTSDHGEAFGERGLIDHGSSVYQDQVYIPLIIKYPRTNEKNVVNQLVSSVDLMPTILDVLGCEIPQGIQGQSLLKLAIGNSRHVISEFYPFSDLVQSHPRFDRVQRAVFSGRFKFIKSTNGTKELYDLHEDPDEKNNLFKPDDKTSRELEARLNQWLEEVKEESGSIIKLEKEALDRLKSLGYIK